MLNDPTVFQQWPHYNQELRSSYEQRLRAMEELMWRSRRGSPSEIEELRSIFEPRLRAVEGSKILYKARLRKMEELMLRRCKGNPSEMEELRSIYGPGLEVIEELRIIYEPRLRVIEELIFRSLEDRTGEMEDSRSIYESTLRRMEESRNFYEARLTKVKASDVKEGKRDEKAIIEERKQYSGNEGNDDVGGAQADKAETQEQKQYEQDTYRDDPSGPISETMKVHDLQLEEHEEQGKVVIFKGDVTSEGMHLDLLVGAIHLTFPPDTVADPTRIMVYRWIRGACLPNLTEHEAVVSDVIEVSAVSDVGSLKFKSEVKLMLSHSATDLEGYELVMKGLTDVEKNEWEEIAGCEDIRQGSVIELEDDYKCPNNIPYSFPVVTAGITKCSTYAVVSRLKLSPTYTITVSGGTFVHPDYPQVAITVPERAVETERRLSLQLKVQEVPQDEFNDHKLFVGPILRVLCSSGSKFLKPVTIQLPISLRDKVVKIPHPSECRVRVFFLNSRRKTRAWDEISDKLENSSSYDGKLVKFKVRGFSRYTFILDWTIYGFSALASRVIGYLSSIVWIQPLVATFFAYFKPKESLNSHDILYLICCPAHLRENVKQEHEREGIRPCDASSKRKMIPEYDKAYVFLSGGISPACSEDMEDFYLRLYNDTPHKAQLQVRLISDQVYCKVEFRNENDNLLSTLNLRLSSPSIDRQVLTASVPRLEEATESSSISASFDTFEWGSTKGGLSRVSQDLPIQLAKRSESKVTPDAVDDRLAAVSSGGVCDENLFALPREVVESLGSRSCVPEEILHQLMQQLNLDKPCLKEPTPETTKMIRCFAAKAKFLNRIDVVRHLRDIAPAGTSGPLLPGDLDVQNIPHVQIRELTINLSGGEDWKVVAERMGFTAPEIRFLDHRTRNPFEAALAHYIDRNPMKVDDLYDILTECGMPVLADIL